jgi:two-component system nitrate/nitrite response regulator NarL
MIRVLIVCEIRLMCDVIASLLADQPDMEVTDAVSTLRAAQELAAGCDVVLISSRLPGEGALRLTRALRQRYPGLKLLLVGLAEEKSKILKFVEAGASGYVLEDDSVDSLLKAIRASHDGLARVSPEIAGALVSRLTELSQRFTHRGRGLASEALTPREQQILSLIGRQYSNQEIADRLVIDVGTVKNHVHRILGKLGVSSRHRAAYYWQSSRAPHELINDGP